MSEDDNRPLLSIRDLNVRFTTGNGYVDALSGIDMDVRRSEILAIVGESGSGKSVTALAVVGLLPADALIDGHIRFDGRDITADTGRVLPELRGRRIAMIFQDPAAALDPVFSIGFQLEEAVRLHEPKLSRLLRRRRAVELLGQVGIDDAQARLKRYPHQFSGGQLQRIMIAMALAGRPDLLIADEPTTALDVTVQQGILDLLHRLNREQGTAILLITHDMGVVADIAQRVVVLHRGRIVETAAVSALFSAPEQDYTRRLLAAVPRGQAVVDATTGAPPRLEVRDLHLAYSSGFGRATEIVRGVSFDIRAGEFLGLVGESGSGKSTIGRSLLGLVPRMSGSVRLDGSDLLARSGPHRGRIGTIFQSPANSLNPRLTIAQSIAEPLQAHTALTAQAIVERVDDLLESVGLPHEWRRRFPPELSGGQRQRVAIARALALDPLLLIADEPTSALDVSIQAEILNLLRNLQQKRHFSCLFISHDLAVVRELCGNVAVLREGKIVEFGATSDVLGRPGARYTQQLVASAPVPDPAIQAERRRVRLSKIASETEPAL